LAVIFTPGISSLIFAILLIFFQANDYFLKLVADTITAFIAYYFLSRGKP